MKRIALLAVIGAGLMALPSTAAAQSGTTNCPAGVPTPGKICVNQGGLGGELVINNSDGCSYINGWATNPPQGQGYAGICTAAVSRGPTCTPGSYPVGASTGGCFQIKPAPPAVNRALNTFPVGLVTAMFICGNTSGENPQNTTRRGCAIP